MYLNRAQKYVLEILKIYGALKQSQLEVMTRRNVYAHLKNLNGYLKQMHQEREIDVMLCGKNDSYICLPDTEPNLDVIAAFDVIISLQNRVLCHSLGSGLAKIECDLETDKNRVHKAFVVVVHQGMEQTVSEYADKYLSDDFQTVFFLCDKQIQIKSISAKCNRIFVVKTRAGVRFPKSNQ